MKAINKPDKRDRKREENRIATLNLAIDMILKTGKEPTIDELAEVSTISRRSIMNYFKDKLSLLTEMKIILTERAMSKFPTIKFKPEMSFEDFITQMILNRSEIFEYTSPFRKVIQGKNYSNSILQEQMKLEIHTEYNILHEQLSYYFNDSSAYEEIIIMFMNTISWHNWSFLRNDLGLVIERSRELLNKQSIAIYNEFKK